MGINKTKVGWWKTLVLVILVLSIPFNVSASLNVQSASGENGVRNYYKNDDTATIVISYSDITNAKPSEFRIFGTYTFNECSATTVTTGTCTFSKKMQEIREGRYDILYRDDIGEQDLQTASFNVYVDKTPPSVSITGIPTTVVGLDTPVNIVININDANTGLASANIQMGKYANTLTVTDDKVTNFIYTTKIRDVYVGGGAVEIVVTAVDKLGNTKIEKKSITVDTIGPELLSYKLIKDNNELRYINSNLKDAKLVITTRGTKTATADLRGWIGSVVTMTPQSNGQFYFDVQKIQTNSPIVINLTDTTGNKYSQTIDFGLVTDDERPILENIYTSNRDSLGRSWVGSGKFKIIAQIKETKSGMSNKNIYLDLTEIIGQNNVRADNCTMTQNKWYCTWNNLNVSSTKGEGEYLYLKVNKATDNAVNNMNISKETYFFIIDRLPPELLDFRYEPKPTKRGDTVMISYTFLDRQSGEVIGVMDPSRLAEMFPITLPCISTQNKLYTCLYQVDKLNSVYTNASALIIAKDAAGNFVNLSNKVEILEINYNITPDFFTHTTELTPSEFDRRAASQVGLIAYGHIILTPKLGFPIRTSGLSIKCDKSVKSYKLFGENTNAPYVELQFDKKIADTSDPYYNINCELSIAVAEGKYWYIKPEVEQVQFKLGLYNNPFGEIDAAAAEKIASLEKKIKDLEAQIKKEEKKAKLLGTICHYQELIAKIYNIIATAKTIVQGVSCALTPVFGVGQGLWEAAGPPLANAESTISKFVWDPKNVDNPLMWSLGGLLKMACFYYNGNLCNADAWGKLAGSMAGEGYNYATSGGKWNIKEGMTSVMGGNGWNTPASSSGGSAPASGGESSGPQNVP